MSFYLSIITTSIDTLILYFILSLGILHAFTFCVQFWKEKYALISKHRRIVSWQRNHSLSNVKERLDFSIEVLYGPLEHEWNIRENSLALLCVEPRFVHQPQENTEPAYDFERTRREVVIDTSKYFRNLDPESKKRSLVIDEIRFIYHFWELRFYAYPACGLHFLFSWRPFKHKCSKVGGNSRVRFQKLIKSGRFHSTKRRNKSIQLIWWRETTQLIPVT